MSVITEGNVSKNILSFTGDEFLFTATVCRSWRCNSNAKCTNFMSIFQSVSRVQEAVASGIQSDYLGNMSELLFDIAVLLGAKLSVLKGIVACGGGLGFSLSVTMRYAAFCGRVGVIQYIEKDYMFDEFDLFEAVRGGHINVIEIILRERIFSDPEDSPINAIVKWPSVYLQEHPSEDIDGLISKSGTEFELELLRRCFAICGENNESAANIELDDFVNDIYGPDPEGELWYHPDEGMSCMELAIRKNRLDIVQVLREHGGEFQQDADTLGSFARAMRQGNCEMLLYLKGAGCVIENGALYEYTGDGRRFDMSTVEFVLQHRLVTIDEGCLSRAIYNGRMDLLELLLQHEAPVCDDHVDTAVAKRNFSLADRLMRVHGCRPTPRAYEFVLTRGASEDSLHENGVGDIQEDAFYLQKLSWVYSTGCRLEFDSFAAMQSDWKWTLIFSYFSEAVVDWFREHL